MKIYIYPGDAWGCGHYRLIFPGQAVSALDDVGMDVTIIEPSARDMALKIDVRNGRVLEECFPADADVVVMQRPTNGFLSQVIPMLQERGVAVVVDMDDDLGCIHPRNPAFRGLQPTRQVRGPDGRPHQQKNLHSWHNARDACRHADLVTVTTPALALRYGGHGRVRIIPNMVPACYLDIPHVDSDVIGWGGTVGTHPDDLQAVGPALAKLVQGGAKFRQVGDGGGVARCLGLRDEPDATGAVELEAWPGHLAEFGIGIAPLALTRFNEAKSRLKPLEYASVGVPWVGSGTPDYRAFHALGCGMIADKPKAWEGILRRLLREPALREDLSASGRRVAAENTFEGNAWLWAEAWAQAAVNKRGVPLAAGRP